MPTGDARALARARLIQRVRAVEHRSDALRLADAQAEATRLSGVADRTRGLANHYARNGLATDGAALRRGTAMSAQLRGLAAMADRHTDEAQRRADAAMADLAKSERRRRRAAEKCAELARIIVTRAERH